MKAKTRTMIAIGTAAVLGGALIAGAGYAGHRYASHGMGFHYKGQLAVLGRTPAGPVMKRVCVDGPVFDGASVFGA